MLLNINKLKQPTTNILYTDTIDIVEDIAEKEYNKFVESRIDYDYDYYNKYYRSKRFFRKDERNKRSSNDINIRKYYDILLDKYEGKHINEFSSKLFAKLNKIGVTDLLYRISELKSDKKYRWYSSYTHLDDDFMIRKEVKDKNKPNPLIIKKFSHYQVSTIQMDMRLGGIYRPFYTTTDNRWCNSVYFNDRIKWIDSNKCNFTPIYEEFEFESTHKLKQHRNRERYTLKTIRNYNKKAYKQNTNKYIFKYKINLNETDEVKLISKGFTKDSFRIKNTFTPTQRNFILNYLHENSYNEITKVWARWNNKKYEDEYFEITVSDKIRSKYIILITKEELELFLKQKRK